MYVLGVTPPSTPFTWFFARLWRRFAVSTSAYSQEGVIHVVHYLLDATADKLAKVTGHNPKSQVLPADPSRCQRQDGTSLGDIPESHTNATEQASEDQKLERYHC